MEQYSSCQTNITNIKKPIKTDFDAKMKEIVKLDIMCVG